MTIQDLIADVLTNLGVLGAGQTPSGRLGAFGLRRLNRIFDTWNAKRQAVYADTITTHTLIPDLQPHTIGPTGATFTVTQRPVSIEAASLVISDLHYPIAIRDTAWWMRLTDPTFASERPTHLNYRPGWPNGSLYLWPVPSSGHTLELLSRIILASVALADTFTFPPGYELAVSLSLEEDLARPLGRPADQDLIDRARQARATIFANNEETPRICTADAGMPGAGHGASWFGGSFQEWVQGGWVQDDGGI
jgi:hypothetical protein